MATRVGLSVTPPCLDRGIRGLRERLGCRSLFGVIRIKRREIIKVLFDDPVAFARPFF
jgi:hypothetical protein